MSELTLCTGELFRLSLVSPDLPLAGHGVLQPGSLPPEFNAAFMYYCAATPVSQIYDYKTPQCGGSGEGTVDQYLVNQMSRRGTYRSVCPHKKTA